MKIPEDQLLRWCEIRSPKDANDIAEMAGCHRNTVHIAFAKGQTNFNVYQAMLKFYLEREKILEKIQNS